MSRISGRALLGGLAITTLGLAGLVDLLLRAQVALVIGGSKGGTPLDNNGFLAACIVLGVAYSALGGWAAGRLAKAEETLHGTVVGLLEVLVGIALYLLPQEESTAPLWFDFAAFLTTIPSAAFGGYLAFVQRVGVTSRGRHL